MKVCLDAGHGVDTVGKRSFDGKFREYEFNRDITRQVGEILSNHGIQVMYTANSENDVSLSDRVRMSNNYKADIFVSFHANAFGTAWNGANGTEIYYAKNSSSGRDLAQCVNSELKKLGLADRGLKETDKFTVVVKTHAPSILIEHFFYTNKDELIKCNNVEFRKQFAIADAKGILKHFGIKYNPALEISYIEMAINKIKDKTGLSESTLKYLLNYKYGEDLIIKLAKAM